MPSYILSIDQGTTSSRAIIFNKSGAHISEHQIDLKQYFPHEGWVEQDPEEIWLNTLICCREALRKANLTANQISAIGITNQRETTIIWDKTTGKPIYRAIVWQDRRTADMCEKLKKHETLLQQKTGLLLDPYFSASKIIWILNHVAHHEDNLAFGTVDSFLLWRMTKGKVHATDASNASRTLLFNIHTQAWDTEILSLLKIPENILPTVLDSAAHFGEMHAEFLGANIPILSMLGDQQAATVGQACFQAGMAKTTYGTGGFILLNTGKKIITSKNKLLTTVAYRIQGETTYGLEGSIFSTGVTVKWLRDSLHLIRNAAETETLARSIPDTEGVYLVPAFTGLGAPYWDPKALGAILGLHRNTGIAHIVRAALEATVYQTRDILECMKLDGMTQLETLRVDGGMAVNDWLLQFLADILNIRVQRPSGVETSALGAAFMAGLYNGIYQSLEEIANLWQASLTLNPELPKEQRETLYLGWKNAVASVRSHSYNNAT